MTANTAVADPRADANVSTSGSEFPREKLPTITENITWKHICNINDFAFHIDLQIAITTIARTIILNTVIHLRVHTSMHVVCILKQTV